MRIQKFLLGSLLAAVSASSFAADSVDLKVVGKIVPSSCTPSLAGDGILDFEALTADKLDPKDFTYVGSKSIDFTLTCEAPVKVGITFTEGRPNSSPENGINYFIAKNAGLPINPGAKNPFGLGSVDGKKVGAYLIQLDLDSANADGASAINLISDATSDFWEQTQTGYAMADSAVGRVHAWAVAGEVTPRSYKVIKQPLSVFVAVNKFADLPSLTSQIQLDGLASIKVSYL